MSKDMDGILMKNSNSLSPLERRKSSALVREVAINQIIKVSPVNFNHDPSKSQLNEVNKCKGKINSKKLNTNKSKRKGTLIERIKGETEHQRGNQSATIPDNTRGKGFQKEEKARSHGSKKSKSEGKLMTDRNKNFNKVHGEKVLDSAAKSRIIELVLERKDVISQTKTESKEAESQCLQNCSKDMPTQYSRPQLPGKDVEIQVNNDPERKIARGTKILDEESENSVWGKLLKKNDNNDISKKNKKKVTFGNVLYQQYGEGEEEKVQNEIIEKTNKEIKLEAAENDQNNKLFTPITNPNPKRKKKIKNSAINLQKKESATATKRTKLISVTRRKSLNVSNIVMKRASSTYASSPHKSHPYSPGLGPTKIGKNNEIKNTVENQNSNLNLQNNSSNTRLLGKEKPISIGNSTATFGSEFNNKYLKNKAQNDTFSIKTNTNTNKRRITSSPSRPRPRPRPIPNNNNDINYNVRDFRRPFWVP